MPRPFAAAWLGGDRAAAAWLPLDGRDPRARGRAAAAAAARRCDAALVDELERQQPGRPPEAAASALAALRAGDAAVVVAGQQVGLFGGPAFSLYKAAGAVAAARRLEEETGVRCVPLFWLQTEDHDWDEIDHCFVRGEDGEPLRLTVHAEGSARIPVAARVYDATIDGALDEFERAVADRPGAASSAALLRRHYRRGETPAAAFRGVISELFAADGLLLLDPRTEAVAKLASPLLRRSVAEAERVSAALVARGRALEEAGFEQQVSVLDGSPLAFVHPDGPSGPRFRLQPRAGGWALRGRDTALSTAEVLDLLDRDPLHLSTSALLRPLVQDALLPTAVVLAGPGEISYFAQLPALYEALDVAMPAVAPRPSLCVTAAGDRRRLEQLGLDLASLPGDREALLARLVSAHSGVAVDPADARDALLGGFLADLDRFATAAVSIDDALARPLARTRDSVEQSVARLVDHYRRSVLRRESVTVDRLDRVLGALAPRGLAQERVYGLASLSADHGVDPLVGAIRAAIEPFDAGMREVAL